MSTLRSLSAAGAAWGVGRARRTRSGRRSGRCGVLVAAPVVVLALASPVAASAAGPSVRTDGRTLRFGDTGVAGATHRVEGNLIEVADSRRPYFVQTASGRLVAVDFGGRDLPDRATNAPVEAEATAAGEVRSATLSTAAAQAAVTPGAQHVYVAKVTNAGAFGDADATIQSTIDKVLTRWKEESNGAITSFTRAAYGTFTTSTDCSSGSAMWPEARAQLYPNVDFGSTSGNHLIVVGAPTCGGGVGTVGSGVNSGGQVNVNWNPAKYPTSLEHELGHNFSLNHANACHPAGPACTFEEYGNNYAVMGFTHLKTPAYIPAALDSFERTRLGIADPGEVAAVTLPAGQRTSTGTYDLHARGTATGLRGLRVTDPTSGTAYSVDWRSGGGRDAQSYYATGTAPSDKEDFDPGITVEKIEADGRSETLQPTPKPNPADGDFFGLTAGRSFSAGGVTITDQTIGDRTDLLATSRVGVTLTDPSVAPDTTITTGPPAGATVASSTVGLAFAGTPADATAGFDCQLDAGAWAACSSPKQLSGLSDGSHTFAVRARDAAGHADATPATRAFTVDTKPAPAPGGGAPAGTGTPPNVPASKPGRPRTPGAVTPTLEPAKLEVTRASVSRSRRRLTIVAPITARASGTVRVTFRAAGKTTSFDAPIDARRRRISVDRHITAAQARGGSGILTLTYGGDADTQPQTVRMRAASRSAGLRAGRPATVGSRLRASGRISARARGVVRVQLLFAPTTGATRTLAYTARIARGHYRLDTALPAEVLAAITSRRGVLHSYTLFTGDLDHRIRGELASCQVLAAR